LGTCRALLPPCHGQHTSTFASSLTQWPSSSQFAGPLPIAVPVPPVPPLTSYAVFCFLFHFTYTTLCITFFSSKLLPSCCAWRLPNGHGVLATFAFSYSRQVWHSTSSTRGNARRLRGCGRLLVERPAFGDEQAGVLTLTSKPPPTLPFLVSLHLL